MTTQPAPPSDDYGAVLRDAISHHQAGRLDDAESRYRQVLDQDPENPDALHLLGVLSCHKGSEKAGMALIRRAIAADARNPLFHSNLVNFLRKIGRLDEAAEAYEAAIGLQPANADALADLGAVYQLQGRFDAAEAACRRAIGVNPDFVQGHYNLGISLKSLGRAEAALDALRRAVQLDPTQIDPGSMSPASSLNRERRGRRSRPAMPVWPCRPNTPPSWATRELPSARSATGKGSGA